MDATPLKAVYDRSQHSLPGVGVDPLRVVNEVRRSYLEALPIPTAILEVDLRDGAVSVEHSNKRYEAVRLTFHPAARSA
jgi:hypothetical protein